jgi:hypothetical protein
MGKCHRLLRGGKRRREITCYLIFVQTDGKSIV